MCADGEWLFLANGQQSVYLPRMFRLIDRPELIDDPRFKTAEARREHKDELYEIFKEAYRSRPCQEWLDRSIEVDLPVVRLNHFADVTEDDQAWANGYLEHMTCRTGETVIMPRSPLHMDSVGELKTVPASRVGQDTEAVLLGLGYSGEVIAALQNSGAVYCGA